jgi:DNA-binding NarL/FixJ family response regulator
VPVLLDVQGEWPAVLPSLNFMPTRILIADDDVPIRRLLRRLLDGHSDWKVCGEATNGREAVLKVMDLEPDVVILDLAMPQMNGLQAAQEISARYPLIAMVLLTVQEVSSTLAKEAQRVGFRGAISKSTGSEVVKGVETMLRGQSFFKLSSSNVADSGL